MFLSSWERTCNFFQKKKNKKESKQTMKTSTNQTHTFGLRLKHVNKQVALLCKFEFGIQGTPNIQKWNFLSHLMEFCTIHGMSLNMCAITSYNMQQNNNISMN